MQRFFMVKLAFAMIISLTANAVGEPSAAPVATQKAPAKATKKPEAKPDVAEAAKLAELMKLANAIQKQYNQTRSATFNFEQTYRHPFLSGPESANNSKGNVAYNKTSGSMMWNYQEPKDRQKKFFINRNKFTFYSISDKIAYTHDCYDKDTLSASVAFLLGTGNLKDSFTVVAFDEENANKTLSWLSLLPKEANAPVKKISLGATKDGRVVESIVEDPSGGKNHFKFIDWKTNPKIPERVFVFVKPAGVHVQPMPNIECATKGDAPQPKAPATKLKLKGAPNGLPSSNTNAQAEPAKAEPKDAPKAAPSK